MFDEKEWRGNEEHSLVQQILFLVDRSAASSFWILTVTSAVQMRGLSSENGPFQMIFHSLNESK